MLIDVTNSMLNTSEKHICISRPRRFGKSMAANMLTAYYSRGCGSRELFSNLKISKSDCFEKHLNKYNVIHISIKDFADMSDSIDSMLSIINKLLIKELLREYPNIDYLDNTLLTLIISDIFRIEDGGWEEVMNSLRQSDELLSATLSENSEKVAEILEEVHMKNTSVIAYSNEMSLSVTLALAYYSARNSYEIFREMPSGKGFADLTFIPRKGVDSPAMVIELKYNNTASNALRQIKEKHYTDKLAAFSGEILLVGICYDENKGHSCVIERINK